MRRFGLTTALLWTLTLAGPAIAADVTALLMVPAGKTEPAELVSDLAAWKASGAIANATLLRAPANQKEPQFSALAVVQFADQAAYDVWARSAKLADGVIASQADTVLTEGAPLADPNVALFEVNHYRPLVSDADYATFVSAYIAPNMRTQMSEGILAQYTMYLEHDQGGKTGFAVLVKQYASQAAFDSEPTVKATHRPTLLADPDWKRYDETKPTIRENLTSTLAAFVPLP